MKIEVKTEDLIKKIKEARLKATREHNTAERKKAGERTKKLKEQARILRDALQQVEAGKPVEGGNRWSDDVSLKLPLVEEPGEFDSSSYDRDISMLEISSKTSIKLDVSDRLAKYL